MLYYRHSDDTAYRMLINKIASKKTEIVAALYECDPQRSGECY